MTGRLGPIAKLQWTIDGWCLPNDLLLPEIY